eukprot:Gb_16104 [translate_table: standard]
MYAFLADQVAPGAIVLPGSRQNFLLGGEESLKLIEQKQLSKADQNGPSKDYIPRRSHLEPNDPILQCEITQMPANPMLLGTECHKSGKNSEFKSRTGLIIGVASGVVLLVTGMILGGFYLQSKARKHGEETLKGEGDGNSQDLGLPNSWKMGARSSILSRTLPKESKSMSVAGFDSDKPIIFTYEEILIASDDFNISKKIGQGSFGAVYLGNLRNKEVAIKQMKDTKSKEFLAELKILCRVHHTNLVCHMLPRITGG